MCNKSTISYSYLKKSNNIHRSSQKRIKFYAEREREREIDSRYFIFDLLKALNTQLNLCQQKSSFKNSRFRHTCKLVVMQYNL